MPKITFASDTVHTSFHSMAEGMWEVRRDDGMHDAAKLFEDLIEATSVHSAVAEGVDYPLTFNLPARLADTADMVLSNCLDNATGNERDEDDEDDYGVYPGEIEITPGMSSTQGCLDCREAISAAIDAIETAHCVEGVPEELQPVVKTLYAILMQRGCEDFEIWGNPEELAARSEEALDRDQYLTSVMDCVIYG